MNRETYCWYKEHGICTRCGQRKAFHGHVYCEVCMEKSVNKSARYRLEHHEKYLKSQAESRQKLRARRKAEGKCIQCGRPAVEGQTLCAACRAVNRERSKQYRRDKYGYNGGSSAVFQKRIAEGKCMFCGEPQEPGYGFCARHLAAIRENMKKAQEAKGSWKQIKDAKMKEKADANADQRIVSALAGRMRDEPDGDLSSRRRSR